MPFFIRSTTSIEISRSLRLNRSSGPHFSEDPGCATSLYASQSTACPTAESMFRTDIRMLICFVIDWWIVSATCFFIAASSFLCLTPTRRTHFSSSSVSTRMIRMRDSEIPSFSIPQKSLGIASASFSA